MGLGRYRAKRDFAVTPEPAGRAARSRARGGLFVIHEHDATRLHYDLRLEIDGVLASWAVPKGPSLDPKDKRLAVRVEDHPLEYAGFEGVIPEGQYGAGPVIVWDRGRWTPEGDPGDARARGRIAFTLDGDKLRGGWALVRMGPRSARKENWLLVKKADGEARRGRAAAVTARRPESVTTGRTVEDVRGGEPPGRGPRGRTPRGARRARTARRAPKAPREPLPAGFSPNLATLVERPPEGDAWVHEVKFDGYRMLARVEGGRARLVSRNGKDWTARFPEIAEAAASLPVEDAILDGEVVRVLPDGRTSFQALQRSLSREAPESGTGALRYFAFDLPRLNGASLEDETLLARKVRLERLLRGSKGPILYSKHVRGRGRRFLEVACRRGLEGIVSKRAESAYRHERTRDWQKARCGERQEFVIAGYAPHSTDAKAIGSLLLGVRERGGSLDYAGRVGTGFDDAIRRDLRRRLDAIARPTSPFRPEHGVAAGRGVRWAEPTLVGEVAFTEWTEDGRLRHPTFLGLREDKPAADVVRERRPAGAAHAGRTRGSATEAPAADTGSTLTHPDRVLWPESRTTKQDLARYYARAAPRMLPYVAGRPLMLLRCPEGRGRACFFQKHVEGSLPRGLRTVDVVERSAKRRYLVVDDAAGLEALAQMSVLEIHAWGSRADRLEEPDRVVFDLDPAPDLPFSRVVRAALEIRKRLEAWGLRSFPMTTGGKGLHVHVPIARRHGWETVKAFARSLANDLASEAPELYVATAAKARRTGRVFVDWLRNARGATAVVPYSTRAREGATVACPLAWKEITPRLDPHRFRLDTMPRRLERPDPWTAYAKTAQRLPAAGARIPRAGDRAPRSRPGHRADPAGREKAGARGSPRPGPRPRHRRRA